MGEPHRQPNVTKDQWRNYMKKKIYHVNEPVSNGSWMILKPPQKLMDVKPEAYYPKLVTIGPLYQNLKPSPVNNFKAQCVKKFMERYGISRLEELIQDLISAEPHKLSHIYNLNLPPSEIEWLQLVVTIDTIFIHEFLLFLKLHRPIHNVLSYFTIFYYNDHTLSLRLERDLLLMGNQIPMSFLKKIALEIPAYRRHFTLADLETTVRAFTVRRNPFFRSEDIRNRFLGFLESKNIKLVNTCEDLLHSLYYSCIVDEQSMFEADTIQDDNLRFSFLLPSASQLLEAGIRFKACEGSISVIKYDNEKHELHLPRLVVLDSTGDLLRNLIAYEITSTQGEEFSMYTRIVNKLIDSLQDLAILKEAKVIENHMENDERFVDMWRNMCIEVPNYGKSKRWKQMMDDIVAHHSSHRRP